MRALPRWHIESRDIDDLVAHPHNARYLTKQDAKQVKTSICKFGLIDKPIITNDGMIIGGHQRITILREMGEDFVDCWVSDEELDEDDINELNIRLNKNVGNWDWDKLANEWDVNMLGEWGFKEQEFSEAAAKAKKPKVTFEFYDSDEMKEFLLKMDEFPSREDGSWSYKMKVKQ